MLFFFLNPSWSELSSTGFKIWLEDFKIEAIKKGISQKTIEATFKNAGSVMLKEDFDNDIKEDLRRRGHTIQTAKSYIGRPVMLTIDQEEGTIYAAGDPEGSRHAASMGD